MLADPPAICLLLEEAVWPYSSFSCCDSFQRSSQVSASTGYHHGEESLVKVIVNLARILTEMPVRYEHGATNPM